MKKIIFTLLVSSILVLIGCSSNASSSIVSSSNTSSTSLKEQEYLLHIEDVNMKLGETKEINVFFEPTDFLFDLHFEVLDGPIIININKNIFTAIDVGECLVKATASNIDSAMVTFSTDTLFKVRVETSNVDLSKECELIRADIGGFDLLPDQSNLVLDYDVYTNMIENSEDLTPILNYKISKYSTIEYAKLILSNDFKFGQVQLSVLAENEENRTVYKWLVENVYVSIWEDVAMVNADFEAGSEAIGWDLENFNNTHPTSNASSIDLTPLKSPATRVFSMYGNVTDEKKEASITQCVDASGFNVGDKLELSCLISTSYGTRVKSIKLVVGNQKIEMKDMASNWRAQIITQDFIIEDDDIVDGQIRVGLAFTAQDETSTSSGWLYADDFSLKHLLKVFPED